MRKTNGPNWILQSYSKKIRHIKFPHGQVWIRRIFSFMVLWLYQVGIPTLCDVQRVRVTLYGHREQMVLSTPRLTQDAFEFFYYAAKQSRTFLHA